MSITGISSRLIEHSLQRVIVLFGESLTLGESALKLGVRAGASQLVRAARRAGRHSARLARLVLPPAAMPGAHVFGGGLHLVLHQVVVRLALRQQARHDEHVIT